MGLVFCLKSYDFRECGYAYGKDFFIFEPLINYIYF